MTPNQARRLYHIWGHAVSIMQNKHEMLASMQTLIQDPYGVPGSIPERVPHGNLPGDPTCRAVMRAEVLNGFLGFYQDALVETVRVKTLVDQHILKLPLRTREILRLRYQEDHTWPEVAACLGYEESGLRGYERAAVQVLIEEFTTKEFQWDLL